MAIKIAVVTRKSGTVQFIELAGDVQIREQDLLDKLSCGHVDYFFDKDGFYDGYGMRNPALPPPPSLPN